MRDYRFAVGVAVGGLVVMALGAMNAPVEATGRFETDVIVVGGEVSVYITDSRNGEIRRVKPSDIRWGERQD